MLKLNHTKALIIPMKKITFIFIFTIICSAYLYAANTSKTDSLENLLKTVNKKEKAKILNELSKAYLPDFPQNSKENAILALQLAKEQNNRKEQAFALKYIGIALSYQSEYEKALAYYNNSLNIFKEIGDKKEVAYLINNMGLIYQDLNRYEDALEYHKRSLKIEEEIDNKRGIANSLNNIGTIYKELKNYEGALEYYQKSLKIIEEIKDKRGIAYSLNNIGLIYQELNNYEDALEYYKKSLKIKEEIKNKRGIAKSLNNIGEVNNKLGKFSEALFCFGKSLEIAKSLDTKDIIIDSYELYSESYSAMGNYKKAFEYHKQYTALKDSVFNLETYQQIADMKNKYETEKKDKQIKALEYENNIKTIKINHHEKTHIIYAIVLFLAIAAITIIFIQYRKKNSAYKFLVQKNIDLLNKENELKILNEKITSNKPNNNRKITINDNIKDEILEKLVQLFDNGKIYRDFDLTIDKLAKIILTNRNYLSQTIYKEFGKNYSDFINEYRIKEAMLMLSDPIKTKQFSIEAIAKDAGFNNISSFNRIFRKFTGVTPSTFINNC